MHQLAGQNRLSDQEKLWRAKPMQSAGPENEAVEAPSFLVKSMDQAFLSQFFWSFLA